MESEIKLQRDRFMGFSFAAADLLIELDGQGRIQFCMGASQNLFGLPVDKLFHQQLDQLVSETDKATLGFLLDNINVGERRGPIKIHTLKNNHELAVQISIFKMPNESGNIHVVINNLDPLSLGLNDPNRDDKTNLLTKNAFFVIAAATISNAKNNDEDINLTLIDMPSELELDEQMGPENAIEFKSKTASLLRALSVNDTAANLDDNNYSVIHKHGLKRDQITREIENISKKYNESGQSTQIGASSIEIDTDVDADEMSRALAYTINQYVSNRQFSVGSSGTSIPGFEKQVTSQVSNTVNQIKWFKNAIRKNKIAYVAQEIVDIKSRRVHHYELLLRFEPDISPFQKLQFAEKVGIIHELDIVTLENAIKWLNDTAGLANFSLAVNISGASIARADFCFKMLKLINSELHNPKRLLIEITESWEIDSFKKVNDFFKSMRAKGVNICIDDFGAGAASLSYLRHLDVDIVKIDGSYIRECMKYGREDKILKAMINLCKSMNLKLIAEQIETPEQAKYLLDLGVKYGQGYLFHKPMPVKSVIEILKKPPQKSKNVA